MAEIIRQVQSNFFLVSDVQVWSQSLTPYYGTLSGAENYFRSKVRRTVYDWIEATPEDKIAALREATQIIERLNLLGDKESEDQILHFPTSEHGTPDKLYIATYEIAHALLKDIDPETEIRNLSATSLSYAAGRSTFDRSFIQEHIRAGVPSAAAWLILRPYLGDPGLVKLFRSD